MIGKAFRESRKADPFRLQLASARHAILNRTHTIFPAA
jgi:hypothetical protein